MREIKASKIVRKGNGEAEVHRGHGSNIAFRLML